MTPDLPTSPAAERNKDPILRVLEPLLPPTGSVLEIASGTGQHVCHFASRLPRITFQPTEPDAASRDSMIVRIGEAGLVNVSLPIALDVHDSAWPVATDYSAIVCINMIHISPSSATDALLRGASRHLQANGKLLLYGPYLENGTAAQSNLDFDASLKRRNPAWGLRQLEEVTRTAASHGFTRLEVVPMPANNLSVVFEKRAAGAAN